MDNLTNHIKLSKPTFKQLSIAAIEGSIEIQDWLAQFTDEQQPIAKTLLSRLKWLASKLGEQFDQRMVANNYIDAWYFAEGFVIILPGRHPPTIKVGVLC